MSQIPGSSPMGYTRSRVTDRYALITPDTHVSAPLVGWENASAAMHISPEMGARFTQYTATLEPGAASGDAGDGVSRFIFVLEGDVQLSCGESHQLSAGQYAFLRANESHQIKTADQPAKIAVFEKKFQSLDSVLPDTVIGSEADAPGEAFQGDDDLFLQTLLPTTPVFDMAMNVFTYQPGGRLPQVECHVMEHGLLMLEGEGVYRLGDDWFPVQTGDVIWMASYCPQWFVAMGKQPAKYLYYKDIHRDRLTEKQ